MIREPDMTPPDDPVCVDCQRERSRLDEEGRCVECATPAGRLVTALLARKVKAHIDSRGHVRVNGHAFVCEAGDESEPWVISDVAETLDETVRTASVVIAAIVQAPALRAERDSLAAEVERLRAELGKPVMLAWDGEFTTHRRSSDASARVSAPDVAKRDRGWQAWRRGIKIASGPETGDAGKHAADVALVAAGYRLAGGVWPAQGEVPDAR